MTDNATKVLIGTIASIAALVAIFAIMSDCSKHIADVEASPQSACVQAGGHWSRLDTMPNKIGHCVKASS